MFNKRELEELKAQNEALQADVQRLSRFEAMEAIAIQKELESLEVRRAESAAELHKLFAAVQAKRSEIVETEDLAILQEVGIYEFSHLLDTAVEYQDRIKLLRERIKTANRKGGGAITAVTNWTVNGSAKEGQRMVDEVSKLMLRAFNGEVDDAVRTLKPYKIDAALDRLEKVRASIVKLGKTMSIQITPDYFALRAEELRLTADFLEKQAEEKEALKDERERLKEEAKAQKEFEAEKLRLEKERTHHETALQKAIESGDEEAAAAAQAQIDEVNNSIAGVEERSANIRAGFVYVISNIGSFGDDVVKIGLTRRIDYMERIHELSSASVPFIFDMHAVVYSNDAVSLEHQLHQALEAKRVNRVNQRKEFFRATPAEVKDFLENLAGTQLLEFSEEAEAVEWRMSASQEPVQAR